MIIYPLEVEANLLQTVLLIVMSIWCLCCHKNSKKLAYNMFVWGLLEHALTDIYWTASLVLDSNEGNVLKASDTTAIAFSLFWISLYQVKSQVKCKKEYFCRIIPFSAVLFSVWNYIWWNLWSINIILNTIWLLCIAMLTFLVFYSLDVSGVFTRKIKCIWFLLLTILFVFEVPMYLKDRTSMLYILSDWICVGVWAIFIVGFTVKAFRDKKNRTDWLFAAVLFSLYAEYLTDGVKYSFFLLSESIVLVLLTLFFREDDFGERCGA